MFNISISVRHRLYWSLGCCCRPERQSKQENVSGHKFPALREADAMFATESPPDWVDGDSCHRCQASFGVLTRKVGVVGFGDAAGFGVAGFLE